MLDGVDAGHDGVVDALVARRVRGDRPSGGVGHLHRGLHLPLAQRRPGRAVRAGAVVGVELDPVGAHGRLLADGGRHLRLPAHLLRALRQVEVGAEALLRPVGTGGHDRPRRHEQPWPRHHPLVDRPLQLHVGVAGALGAQVPLGGEAAHQGARGVASRAQHPIGRRLLQHLVVPEDLVVGAEQQVRVELDQPGDQGLAGQGDHSGARRGRHRALRPDAHDAVALDRHHPARVRRRVARAPHSGRLQEVARRLGGPRRPRERQRRDCSQYGRFQRN